MRSASSLHLKLGQQGFTAFFIGSRLRVHDEWSPLKGRVHVFF